MKKYLLVFCLLFAPLFSNTDSITDKKLSLIEMADNHRQQAIKALKEAEEKVFYFPDLSLRQHLKTLISSTIGLVAIPEPRMKFLAVGLSLIASFADDMFDQWSEYRLILTEAAYHFEMVNFYISASRKMTDLSDDEGTRDFMFAIDCMLYCDLLVTLIEHDYEYFDPARAAIEYISYYRKIFVNEFKKSNGKLTKKLSVRAQGVYEDLAEILESSDDPDLNDKLNYLMGKAVDSFEKAEKYWKIK